MEEVAQVFGILQINQFPTGQQAWVSEIICLQLVRVEINNL